MTTKKNCRWGILGSAGIARKNWQAIRDSGNGELVAVASRDISKAQQFIDACQAQAPHPLVPKAAGGYESILEDESIDAVYIPLPTGLRKEWVIKAAAAGKHVLSEKPCGISADDVSEMTQACAAAGVQFMDGVMFMHTDRLAAAAEILAKGEAVGEIKRITSSFSFMAPGEFFEGNIRMSSELEPLGSLGDLGWYCIRMILWAMDYTVPTSVSARMIREAGRSDSPQSVPISLSAELLFEGGSTAAFFCSFEAEHQQWVNVTGTKGALRMDDFVQPFIGPEIAFFVDRPVVDHDGCTIGMENHTTRHATNEYGNNHRESQEAKLFRTFADLVISGNVDPFWPEVALKTQRVLEACLASARDSGREISV